MPGNDKDTKQPLESITLTCRNGKRQPENMSVGRKIDECKIIINVCIARSQSQLGSNKKIMSTDKIPEVNNTTPSSFISKVGPYLNQVADQAE